MTWDREPMDRPAGAGWGRPAAVIAAAGCLAFFSSFALSSCVLRQPSGQVPASGPRAPASRPGPAGGSPRPGPAATAMPGLAGVRWVSFHGAELPVSPSAGPRVTRDGVAWGFADTRLGALLAAVNIGVRAAAWWGPGVFGPTIRDQVIGADAGVLLSGCEAAYEQAWPSAGVPAGAPLGPAPVTEEAFAWVSYRPWAAVVDIVSAARVPSGGMARAVTWVALRWRDGDWRVVAPPGGDWNNAAAPLPSLRGYTLFPDPPR